MPAVLIRLIAFLFAALFAPAKMIARVMHLETRALRGLARLLKRMQKRGMVLRYEGEGDDIVAARVDFAAWIARDPLAALKHMVRKCRCPRIRARFACVAPCADAPPVLQIAPLVMVTEVREAPDTS